MHHVPAPDRLNLAQIHRNIFGTGSAHVAPLRLRIVVQGTLRTLLAVHLSRTRDDRTVEGQVPVGLLTLVGALLRKRNPQQVARRRHGVVGIRGDRSSKHHDPRVVRKDKFTRALRDVEARAEQVGELVGYIPVGDHVVLGASRRTARPHASGSPPYGPCGPTGR